MVLFIHYCVQQLLEVVISTMCDYIPSLSLATLLFPLVQNVESHEHKHSSLPEHFFYIIMYFILLLF